MPSTFVRSFAGLGLCLLGAALAAGGTGDPMDERAAQLSRALRPELRERASFSFADARRVEWQYHYYDWPGVTLGELESAEQQGFDRLLRSALSERGLAKVRGVLQLQGIIHEESGRVAERDPGRYSLAFWGVPGGSDPWSWRLAGHHLALNYTLAGGEVAGTPFFLGAYPAEVRSGPHEGLRVLHEEERLARALLASLSADQRARAVRAEGRPGDVLFGPGQDPAEARPDGIPAAELTQEQRALLEPLLREYIGNLRPDLAERELARCREGFAAIHFLWLGSTEVGQPFYYRLHGPHFIVEFDVTGVNHVHALWRDLERDFGGDLLRRHVERERR